MTADDQEILDIVDNNDQVIMTLSRSEADDQDKRKGGYIRAASCFLMNSQDQLYVPRRKSTKRIAPNALDYSASGHVQAGETYMQGMLREIEEEL